MGGGPKKITPDYKGMWQSYSGWMQEEQARSRREMSSARAKLAMRGVKEGSTAWTSELERTQTGLAKSQRDLKKGYTAAQLKDEFGKSLSIFGGAGHSGGFGRYGDYKKTIRPAIEKAGGIDNYLTGLKDQMVDLEDQVKNFNSLDYENQKADIAGQAVKFKFQNLSTQYKALKTAQKGKELLEAQGVEGVQMWEGYFAGMHGPKEFKEKGPTAAEASEEQARKAGSGQATRAMGAVAAGDSSSPWYSETEDKTGTQSPNM